MDTNELLEFLRNKDYEIIEIKKYVTGHLYLEIIINDVKGVFILDTGAGATVIDEKQKVKFNINSDESDKKATGTGGEMAVQISQNNSLKIGRFKLENIQIVVMNLDHINNAFKEVGLNEVDGVIGADILTTGNAIIDYTNMILFLNKY